MYRNILKYNLRFTDVDAYDNLKPSSLLSFMEESACISADELGFGYNTIMPLKLGFVIANCYVEFKGAVKLGDTLEVHTWPLKPKHMIFLRDFEFFKNGEKIGAGVTRWCMINTENYNMAPVSVFFKEKDFENYNTERSMEFSSWKIPSAQDGEPVYSKKIGYSDYDHYFHVNNTKYGDYLLDAFNPGELKGKFFKKLQVTFAKQCKAGETIEFYKKAQGNVFTVEGRVENETRVQYMVETDEI